MVVKRSSVHYSSVHSLCANPNSLALMIALATSSARPLFTLLELSIGQSFKMWEIGKRDRSSLVGSPQDTSEFRTWETFPSRLLNSQYRRLLYLLLSCSSPSEWYKKIVSNSIKPNQTGLFSFYLLQFVLESVGAWSQSPLIWQYVAVNKKKLEIKERRGNKELGDWQSGQCRGFSQSKVKTSQSNRSHHEISLSVSQFFTGLRCSLPEERAAKPTSSSPWKKAIGRLVFLAQQETTRPGLHHLPTILHHLLTALMVLFSRHYPALPAPPGPADCLQVTPASDNKKKEKRKKKKEKGEQNSKTHRLVQTIASRLLGVDKFI